MLCSFYPLTDRCHGFITVFPLNTSACFCCYSISPVQKSSAFLAKNPVHGKIVGIGSVESSFLFQVTRCFDSFDHADLAPLMVFLECLTTLEVSFSSLLRYLFSNPGGTSRKERRETRQMIEVWVEKVLRKNPQLLSSVSTKIDKCFSAMQLLAANLMYQYKALVFYIHSVK